MGTFTPELTFGSYSYGTMSESPGILYKTIQIGDQPSLNFDFTAGVLDSKITFTRASSGTYFNSSGVLTTASANTARFSYDPATFMAQGLLIEEQRTNLLTYSERFDNASWVKYNITVTTAATTSPDGTVNAQKLAATTTATTQINTTTVPVAATSATFSVYVKQGTGASTANTFLLRNFTTATNLVGGALNYSTGVWTYTTGVSGVTVTNAGNGWWRLQITATSGITSGDSLLGYVGFVSTSATAGDFLYAYGAQLEAGAFATSYIPTAASQVTRTADVATITGANFSQWYNQSAGTFVVEASKYVASSDGYLTTADSGSIANFVGAGVTGTTGFLNITTGGVAQAFQTAGAITANNIFKLAAAAATNDAIVAVNGAISAGDTVVTMPTPDRLRLGASASGGTILNGHIRSVRFYPSRLSNAQLQALTA